MKFAQVIQRKMTENELSLMKTKAPLNEVIEWVVPSHGIKIIFWVVPTPNGRLLFPAFPLNKGGSPRGFVHEMCMATFHMLKKRGKKTPEQLDTLMVMMTLHFMVMPTMKEFRTRKYRYIGDYRAASNASLSPMPLYFIEEPQKRKAASGDLVVDPTTSRKSEFLRAAGPVYGDLNKDNLTLLAAWCVDQMNSKPLKTEEAFKYVVRSFVATEVDMKKVEEARTGEVVKRIISSIEKTARKDEDVLAKTIARIVRQGFHQLASAKKPGAISKNDFRQEVLYLVVDSFQHIGNLFAGLTALIRESLTEVLNEKELEWYDLLYSPQSYWGNLPALFLWPRPQIFFTSILRVIHGALTQGKLWNIPRFCNDFAEMDDFNRSNDLEHKAKKKHFDKLRNQKGA